jgi:hypothetical protein
MKVYRLVFLTIVLFSLTTQAQTSDSAIIAELEDSLRAYSFGPIGAVARGAVNELESLKGMLKTAGKRNDSLQIDVALQWHVGDFTSPEELSSIFKSQRNIVESYKTGAYDLFSAEGIDAVPLNFQTALQAQKYKCQLLDRPFDGLDMELNIRGDSLYRSEIYLMIHYPKRELMGWESVCISLFHRLWAEKYGAVGNRIGDLLLDVRSLNAILRTRARLKEIHGHKALITIGNLHGPHMDELLTRYRIRHTIISTF